MGGGYWKALGFGDTFSRPGGSNNRETKVDVQVRWYGPASLTLGGVYISDFGLQSGLCVQLGEDFGHPELSLGKKADHIGMRMKL